MRAVRVQCVYVWFLSLSDAFPQDPSADSPKRVKMAAEVTRLLTRLRDDFLRKTCLQGELVRDFSAYLLKRTRPVAPSHFSAEVGAWLE